MADLFIAPILAYVEQMPDGPSLLADAPNVQRAQKVIHARQSFIATDPATQPPHG
jgi:glutathione S-transferase